MDAQHFHNCSIALSQRDPFAATQAPRYPQLKMLKDSIEKNELLQKLQAEYQQLGKQLKRNTQAETPEAKPENNPEIEELRNRIQVLEDKITKLSSELDAAIKHPVGGAVGCEGDPKAYRLENGVKRWYPNREVFFMYHQDWSEIHKMSADALNRIPEGVPMIPEGTAISCEGDPKAYRFHNNTKRWYPNPPIYFKYHKKWDEIVTLPKEAIAAIPTGPNME